ncbi:MAG: hypothetical protein IJ157_08965 [Clostridia bacterium]|nr:hypothetical protein [Clostridia bacterium]
MLKTLLKIRWKALLYGMFARRRGKKNSGKGMMALFAILLVYAVVAFGFIFGMMFYSMYEPFHMIGMGWLYYSMAAVLSTMMCFIGSVFFTQSLIFDAKDNELLLSMPIRPSAILGSRLLLLLLINYGYSLLIMGACGVVRCILAPVTAVGVIRYLLCCLLLPLMPSALSCIVGGLIALIISRLRNKNFFTMLLSLAFLGAYFAVCFNMQSYIERMVQNGAAIGAAIQKALPPFYAMGLAMENGDWGRLLIFALWCIAPFALVYALLSRGFIRIATAKRGQKKIKYEARAMRASSLRWAMTQKELRRLANSSSYMLNGCLGAILSVAVAALTLIRGQSILQTLANVYAGGADVNAFIMPMACIIECFTLSMTNISAPSISLEGKNIWVLQSAPLRAADVLLPKVYMHLIVAVPASLISSLLFVLALPMAAADALLLFVTPLMVSVFMALLGVIVNLRWPRFDYTNETMVIKQSVSATVTMFSGMGLVLLPVLLYALVLSKLISVRLMLTIFASALAIANVILYDYLAHRADRAFAKLNQG